MSNFIASEEQAERIGKEVTNGQRGKDFSVFFYEQPSTRLTLFGIKIIKTGKQIIQG